MTLRSPWLAPLVLVSLILAAAQPGEAMAAELGSTCDGIAAIRCDPGLFCEHRPDQCRLADGAGRCARRPDVCTQQYRPVCACNGRTYSNDCMRRLAGEKLRHLGACRSRRPGKTKD